MVYQWLALNRPFLAGDFPTPVDPTVHVFAGQTVKLLLVSLVAVSRNDLDQLPLVMFVGFWLTEFPIFFGRFQQFQKGSTSSPCEKLMIIVFRQHPQLWSVNSNTTAPPCVAGDLPIDSSPIEQWSKRLLVDDYRGLYYINLYQSTLYYIIPYYTILYHIIPYYTIIIVYYTTQYHGMIIPVASAFLSPRFPLGPTSSAITSKSRPRPSSTKGEASDSFGQLFGGLGGDWLPSIFYFPMKILSISSLSSLNWRSHIFQRGGPTTNQFWGSLVIRWRVEKWWNTNGFTCIVCCVVCVCVCFDVLFSG